MIGSVTMSDDTPRTERVANVVQGTLMRHSRAHRSAPTTISVIWVPLTRHLRRRDDSPTLWNPSLCNGAFLRIDQTTDKLLDWQNCGQRSRTTPARSWVQRVAAHPFAPTFPNSAPLVCCLLEIETSRDVRGSPVDDQSGQWPKNKQRAPQCSRQRRPVLVYNRRFASEKLY